MLTGDKLAKLVLKEQYGILVIAKCCYLVKPRDCTHDALEFLCNKASSCLLINSESLMFFLDTNKSEFIIFTVQLSGVIAYHCTLPQKSDIARLIRALIRKHICFICDSENDVSMVRAACWVWQYYTMVPVFSPVLDADVDEPQANLYPYPDLYKKLTEGYSLNYLAFFVRVLLLAFTKRRGEIIQNLSQILVGLDHFNRIISVSLTVLILNGHIMAALEITTW
ncbi:unnamed protein product, partial [Tuber aestivum]